MQIHLETACNILNIMELILLKQMKAFYSKKTLLTALGVNRMVFPYMLNLEYQKGYSQRGVNGLSLLNREMTQEWSAGVGNLIIDLMSASAFAPAGEKMKMGQST